MKNIYSLLLFLLCVLNSNSQNIIQMEYFIDIDPGFGNAQNITGFNSQVTINNYNFPITNNLTSGIHNIGYRSKNDNNVWSHTNFSSFYVVNSTPLQNITQMEYFIDIDPGLGNATTVVNFPPNALTNISDYVFAIPNTLTNGIHTIGYRTKDASKQWSHTNFTAFHVLENDVLYDIVELEYFWNIDGGFGNNYIYDVTDISNLSEHLFQANVPSNLSIGSTAILFVRSKDSRGIYSHTNYITEITIDSPLDLDHLEKMGITIFPNPVQDYLTVSSKDNEPFRFVLYDINGKLISDLKITSTEEIINLSDKNSGVYLGYIWKEQNRIQTFKIIKK